MYQVVLIFVAKKILNQDKFWLPEYLNKFENSTCIPQVTVDFFGFLHSYAADNKHSKYIHVYFTVHCAQDGL